MRSLYLMMTITLIFLGSFFWYRLWQPRSCQQPVSRNGWLHYTSPKKDFVIDYPSWFNVIENEDGTTFINTQGTVPYQGDNLRVTRGIQTLKSAGKDDNGYTLYWEPSILSNNSDILTIMSFHDNSVTHERTFIYKIANVLEARDKPNNGAHYLEWLHRILDREDMYHVYTLTAKARIPSEFERYNSHCERPTTIPENIALSFQSI